MKNSICTGSTLIVLMLIISLLSCSKEREVGITNECEQVCLNGGNCVDNNCECPDGFFGELCEQMDIQELLNNGESPLELYNNGVALEELYGKRFMEGIIFFVDINNEFQNFNGLVADESSIPDKIWGCQNVFITQLLHVMEDPAFPEVIQGAKVGDGYPNTTIILNSPCNGLNSVALLCSERNVNGVTGWFLPSRGELDLIHRNLELNGHQVSGGEYFWSSTGYDDGNVWVQNLTTGVQSPLGKTQLANLKAIKSF